MLEKSVAMLHRIDDPLLSMGQRFDDPLQPMGDPFDDPFSSIPWRDRSSNRSQSAIEWITDWVEIGQGIDDPFV